MLRLLPCKGRCAVDCIVLAVPCLLPDLAAIVAAYFYGTCYVMNDNDATELQIATVSATPMLLDVYRDPLSPRWDGRVPGRTETGVSDRKLPVYLAHFHQALNPLRPQKEKPRRRQLAPANELALR